MADRPSSGDTNWAVTLNNHLATSLKIDGSLKGAAVASKFTPSTYAGEQSVTLPNGLVIKFGIDQMTSHSKFEWDTPFSTALISVLVTAVYSNNAIRWSVDNSPAADVDGFTLLTNAGAGFYYAWMAIGY